MNSSEGGKGQLEFTLLSDLKKEITTSFNHLNEDGVSLRGLFIIDTQGIVLYVNVNNLKVGLSVHKTLRLLQSIQHVQKILIKSVLQIGS
jgi:peroxiredoxin (alkyl hydroperoxide reductase subunit C)